MDKNSDEILDSVVAPWGYFCSWVYDMPAHRDTLYNPERVKEYLFIEGPATFDEWWALWVSSNNTRPECFVSEGDEHGYTVVYGA